MTTGEVSYEIQRLKDDRWITVELRETENLATTLALQVLAKSDVESVRVIKSWMKADGTETETLVMSQSKPKDAKNKLITIVPISTAHMCGNLEEFYSYESRATINRLFRKYIDNSFASPCEILHNFRSIQTLQSYGSIFMSGVSHVATLQISGTGGNAKERMNVLFDIADQITKRSKKALEHPLRVKLKGHNLEAVIDGHRGKKLGDKEHYLTQVSLCEELLPIRSWPGKFNYLAQILLASARDDVIAIVDPVMADLIAVPDAFVHILGFQSNLAHALCSIVDLYEGTFDVSKSDAPQDLAPFVPLIAAGKLPETSLALQDRIIKLITSLQPLDRFDHTREGDAFQTIMVKFDAATSLKGNPRIINALKERANLLIQAGFKIPPPPPQNVSSQNAAAKAKLPDIKSRQVPANTVIYREGDAPDLTYLIISGTIAVTRVRKGKTVVLTQLQPGAFFGELALFSPLPRTETMTTQTDCEVLVIDKDYFESRVSKLEPFFKSWMSFLVKRITDLSQRAATASGRDGI